MFEQRISDNDASKRDVPSFIEPRPPLVSNPFMRPRPQKATNLLKMFDEESECEEPELVQVYLRLKPCNIPSNLYEVRSNRYLITSLDTTTAGHGRRTQHNVSKMYTFSHIFGPDANQKEIFENVVKDNLKKLPDGHNFTLLTYGASGSGKTYTLMGTVASPGLVPRSLEYVFRVVEAAQQPLYKPSEGGADKLSYAEQEYELQWVKRLRHISAPVRDKYRRMSVQLRNDMTASTMDLSNRTRYYVWVSFVEIYNEGIYDLLAPGDRRNASKLLIREDSSGTVYVKGATQAFVRTGEEAYDVMVAGKHNLQVAATGVHAQSSRSHCIFTITMLTHTEEGVRISCVRLCDLAGCERARHTRNTGARMQESRAINSSLHVLERCLHTLRRKQRAASAALVPYRESKLTRLLGAGLSGARGEAVSMVVTLNPAPEYAHETRHVLQLAAVARDIQINNTMSEYPSSLETTQDSTIDSSVELMKLRAENERLHFELVQAHSRNVQLTALMEERQAATADTMRSLVEEAREITRHYYESQLAALRNEMEEMAQEYESRLNSVKVPRANEAAHRSLQNKVTELMTEIAILEEKLTAERLARARAVEEVQHLRACIEERDENILQENAVDNNDDLTTLSDSEKNYNEDREEDQDPCNESLEPTFTKEDLNRSRLIRQSILQEQYSSEDDSIDSLEKSEESVLEISTHTIKDIDNVSLDDDDCDIERLPKGLTNSLDNIVDHNCILKDMNEDENVRKNHSNEEVSDSAISSINLEETPFDNEVSTISSEIAKNICRGTYFVADSKIKNEIITEFDDKQILSSENNETRKTINITNISDEKYESIIQDYEIPTIDTIETTEENDPKTVATMKTLQNVLDNLSMDEKHGEMNQWEIPRKSSDPLVHKIISSLRCTTNSNNSLTQFEQLEQAARDCGDNDSLEINPRDEFCGIKLLKEKRTYFDDSDKEYQLQISNPVAHRSYFDNSTANSQKVVDEKSSEDGNEVKNMNEFRSPPIVTRKVTDDFEPSAIKSEPVTVVKKKNNIDKKHDSIDVFDSPITGTAAAQQAQNIKNVQEPIEKFVINDNLKIPRMIPTIIIIPTTPESDGAKECELQNVSKNNLYEKEVLRTQDQNIDDFSSQSVCNYDNTIDAFENIYKNITTPRTTEFESLVSQETNGAQINEAIVQDTSTGEAAKYNLRNKSQTKVDKNKKDAHGDKGDKTKKNNEEVLLESQAKCESRQPSRRNLRLRKCKNILDDDDWKVEEKEVKRSDKLKDIVNLQNEFSDVTIDIPAPVKYVKDIPSPEKVKMETENVPPMKEVQSCPSKSVTRSRRKLFTPRAEPLEESSQGESGERVRVPRPSYHRPRARRRL